MLPRRPVFPSIGDPAALLATGRCDRLRRLAKRVVVFDVRPDRLALEDEPGFGHVAIS